MTFGSIVVSAESAGQLDRRPSACGSKPRRRNVPQYPPFGRRWRRGSNVTLPWTLFQRSTAPAERETMRRLLVLAAAFMATSVVTGPAAAAAGSSVAALQVALRAHGQYAAPIDGVDGPLTRTGLTDFQQKKGLPRDGHGRSEDTVRTRRARKAAARPAGARSRRGRLGRLVARVPPDPVWPRPDGG